MKRKEKGMDVFEDCFEDGFLTEKAAERKEDGVWM